MLKKSIIKKYLAILLSIAMLITAALPVNLGMIVSNAAEAYVNTLDPDVFTGGYSMGGDGSAIVYTLAEDQGVTSGDALSLAYTRSGNWGPVYHTNLPADWDLTETKYIIFDVRGDGNPADMYIGVEESGGGDQFRKLISVTGNTWNKIIIPVAELEHQQNGNGILDWDKVNSINLSVETDGSGTILIDNFTFNKSGILPEEEPPYSMPVILNNFYNDDTGNWSLFSDSGAGASISVAAAEQGKKGKAIAFSFVNMGWGSGSARSTEANNDWSRFTGVSLWAKGEAGQQFKFKFEEDSSHLDEWAKTLTLTTNEWEKFEIQFTDEFEKTNGWKGDPKQDDIVDLSNIINYGIIPVGESGTFLIDEIILTSPVEGCTISDVSTNVLGSVFTNHSIAVSVGLSNFGASEVQKTLSYEVKDLNGAVVAQGEVISDPVQGMSEGLQTISFTVEKYGYYTVDVCLLDDKGEKDIVISRPFVYLTPSDNSLTAEAHAGVGFSTHYDYLNEGQISMEAQLIKLSGANLARQDFLWNMVEPTNGQFDWSFYDRVVDINHANGIDTIGLLCYSTPWSSTVGPIPIPNDIINHYPPKELEDFADYVYQTVLRYKDKVTRWEIWNEPNLNGFFRPTNSPEAYFYLLRAGYLAAKRADPNAKVVMAGLSGTGAVYMQELLDLGAAEYTDALVIHPYQGGDPEAGDVFVNDILGTREKAPEKDIWITEWGWQTKEHDLKKQAVYTAKGFVLALASGVENIALYSFNQATDTEYGLVNASIGGMVKPVYATVNALNGAMAGREYMGDVNLGANVKAYAFTKSGVAPMLALWSSTNETVQLDSSSDAVLYDMYGNAEIISPVAGKLNMSLTNEPKYLVGSIESVIADADPKFAKEDASEILPLKSWQTKYPYYNRSNPSVTRGMPGHFEIEVCNYQNKTIKGLLKIEGLPESWFSNNSVYKAYEVGPFGKQLVSFNMAPPDDVVTGEYQAKVVDISAAGNLKAADYTISVEASLSVNVNKNSIILFNNFTEEISGNVVFDTPEGWAIDAGDNTFTVQPGESAAIPYTLIPGSSTLTNGELTLSGQINAGTETISFSQILYTFVAEPGTVASIDGVKDSQWDGAVKVALNKSEQVSMDYVTYSGLPDLSADVYAKWDSDYLYLLAEVTDDIHNQPNSGGSMWQGDSLQIAFDAANTGGGDYPWGNEVQIGKNALSTDEFSKTMANSLLAINRDNAAKTTTYEMRIPYAALEGLDGIASGKAIGFSLLINDNDGTSREGYMEWSSGIGAAKSTQLFGTLYLK